MQAAENGLKFQPLRNRKGFSGRVWLPGYETLVYGYLECWRLLKKGALPKIEGSWTHFVRVMETLGRSLDVYLKSGHGKLTALGPSPNQAQIVRLQGPPPVADLSQ